MVSMAGEVSMVSRMVGMVGMSKRRRRRGHMTMIMRCKNGREQK